MESIVSQRAVQLSTVQSYMAEAMAAGYSYPWHRIEVPFSMLASLCGHLRAYHKQQLLSDAALLQKQPGGTTQMQDDKQQQAAACQQADFQALPASPRQGLCAGAGGLPRGRQDHHHQQQQQQYVVQHEQYQQPLFGPQLECVHQAMPKQAAAVKVQSAAEEGASGQPLHGGMQGQAVCGHCALLKDAESARLQPDGWLCVQHGTSSSAQAGGQRPVQFPDMHLVRELVVTSKGTKAIRDSMDTLVLSYGEMRLALAHIYCLLRHHICSCQT